MPWPALEAPACRRPASRRTPNSVDVILEQPLGERFVEQALTNTDPTDPEGKSISPGFLFARRCSGTKR